MCRLERGFNVFMEAFSQFVGHVDSMIWSMVLVLLCLGVGLYLSIRMKFPQIRFLKEMVHLLGAKEESENGITPFQAFATTVGARVGMGNIAGVASAIYFGGPGSVFWMWIISPEYPYSEVVGFTENSDGTITLTANVVFPYAGDPKVYAHEVVVRPLEDGGVQYVSNQIIPSEDNYEETWHTPRLTLEEWEELYGGE